MTHSTEDLERELSEIELNEEEISVINLLYCLIDYYYDVMGFSTGGPLHIVLDDYNLEDGHILSCKKHCIEIKDAFGMLICEALLKLPEDKREAIFEHRWYFNQKVTTYNHDLQNRLTTLFTKPLISLALHNEEAYKNSSTSFQCPPTGDYQIVDNKVIKDGKVAVLVSPGFGAGLLLGELKTPCLILG